MPWYYIEVHHGGGHQSTTSRWIWRDKAVPVKTSKDIENLVDGHFDSDYLGESAIFYAKKVTKLPQTVKDNLLKAQTAAIDSAMAMRTILLLTDTHPKRCPLQAEMMDRKSMSRPLRENPLYQIPQARCLRTEGHKGKCIANRAKMKLNREKFGSY